MSRRDFVSQIIDGLKSDQQFVCCIGCKGNHDQLLRDYKELVKLKDQYYANVIRYDGQERRANRGEDITARKNNGCSRQSWIGPPGHNTEGNMEH